MLLKPNDRVVYSQINIFENQFLGKRGTVMDEIPFDKTKIVVMFDDCYLPKEVDPDSLEKES